MPNFYELTTRQIEGFTECPFFKSAVGIAWQDLRQQPGNPTFFVSQQIIYCQGCREQNVGVTIEATLNPKGEKQLQRINVYGVNDSPCTKS